MNTKHLSVAVICAALSFTACKKETTENSEPETEVVDTTAVSEPAVDTTATVGTPSENEVKLITVTGKVTEINQGKDGYTAKLMTENGIAYSATISIPNLDNPKQYRAVKIGDNITVKGEHLDEGEGGLMKVTELQP